MVMGCRNVRTRARTISGASDVDKDGDGTPECKDPCQKTSDASDRTWMVTGRRKARTRARTTLDASDVDTDGDGTPECKDACQNDVG